MSSIEIPYSEACERNKDPILRVMSDLLDKVESVLEIGSGTAQHAVYFASEKPHLIWQTSDQSDYLNGIEAQLSVAGVANVLPPIQLDVNQSSWDAQGRKFDLVYTANTFHIMRQEDVEAFFRGLKQVASNESVLVIYGPLKINGQFTSESNLAFDQRLRARGVGSAIRDLEWVENLARDAGFRLEHNHYMPANNQCLIFHHDT